MSEFTFYLGTHMESWLATAEVPLFISRRRLCTRRTFPRAAAPWVLDSGGFTELRDNGGWTITVSQYASEVSRFQSEIGRLSWAAPMDWMCEPGMIAKTGLDIPEHQRRTIANYLDLRDRCGPVIAPVLQGWTISDYLDHADQYASSGVDLRAEPIVALGSVCRRGQDREIHAIIRQLASLGLSLHAFGVRAPALSGTLDVLRSSDSMSWSQAARRATSRGELPDHPHPRGAKGCANCLVYALRWRTRILGELAGSIFYTGVAA